MFGEWRSKCSGLFEEFRRNERRLPTLNGDPEGVPRNHAGFPAILLHKLSARWTRDSKALWTKVDDPSSGVVPVVGVSGCGKTRFLYEVLASPGKWGFYLTATTDGNGGSRDIAELIELVNTRRTYVKDPYVLAVQYMHCLILSRLLILKCFLEEFTDLTPLEWLILQTEFGVFLPNLDPYWSLTESLVNGLELEGLQEELRQRRLKVLEEELHSRWKKIGERVNGTLNIALDEAQVLAGYLQEYFESPYSNEKRAIFSPFIDALLKPAPGCGGHKVLVSGTAIGKSGAQNAEAVPYTLAQFSPWADADELEPAHAADNAQYLLDKFRGRRRCLVSCVELLMIGNNGKWSKDEVDNFFKRITTYTEKFYKTSLYRQVQTVFSTSKGLFIMDGLRFDAAALLRRMGTFIAFCGRPAFLISSKNNTTLFECSLGRIERVIDEEMYEYVIEEPMVHAALLNYLERHGHFESCLKELMASSRDDASHLGRLWEKIFTIHIPKLFDGTKKLADMICFKGADLPPEFSRGKPRITGSAVGAWRESKEQGRSLTDFLNSDEQSRQQCFMFMDSSGPDILFLVRFSENLLIPCLCQLKLRSDLCPVLWRAAEMTTNAEESYKRDAVSKSILISACKNGYISLIVVCPARNQSKPHWEGNRLVGYIGQEEMEVIFGKELCAFLKSLKEGSVKDLV
ncbi:hypothetical protein KC19_1G108200 [Ceratodon purpureus]|uniref:Uncharacterized protein n=1 Tax=Ceratodon purpureus TaxID=3225 RepID=A0A8T0J4K5_CERPU|nr:hypothetical protein KC19_1G108200 [Ceratodon purpureus]